MVAYGVASRAMYDFNADADNDDLTFDGRSIFRHIIYPSYYLMYGEIDGDTQALDRMDFIFWLIVSRNFSF